MKHKAIRSSEEFGLGEQSPCLRPGHVRQLCCPRPLPASKDWRGKTGCSSGCYPEVHAGNSHTLSSQKHSRLINGGGGGRFLPADLVCEGPNWVA